MSDTTYQDLEKKTILDHLSEDQITLIQRVAKAELDNFPVSEALHILISEIEEKDPVARQEISILSMRNSERIEENIQAFAEALAEV